MPDGQEKSDAGEILTNPKAVRVVNLLATSGVRSGAAAYLLRALAEWYEPSGYLSCTTCGDPFKPKNRNARYCSRACKQRAYRKRNGA